MNVKEEGLICLPFSSVINPELKEISKVDVFQCGRTITYMIAYSRTQRPTVTRIIDRRPYPVVFVFLHHCSEPSQRSLSPCVRFGSFSICS